MDVAGDEPLVGDALGLFLGLRGASLEQRALRASKSPAASTSALRQSIIGALGFFAEAL